MQAVWLVGARVERRAMPEPMELSEAIRTTRAMRRLDPDRPVSD
jgi:hypothetical protein